MDKLIEVLPQFILCIVLGFAFLRVFRYMCTIKNSDMYEHIVWESLLLGFVLKNCYAIIPFSINPAVDALGMIISTVILAGVLAKIYSYPKIDTLLRKIGVYRTRHKFIWQDIEDKEYITYINAINPDTKEAYFGFLKYYEDFEKHPQIVLQNYKYWEDWHNEKPTLDFSKEPEYVMLLDTTQFSRITAIYQPESEKVNKKE